MQKIKHTSSIQATSTQVRERVPCDWKAIAELYIDFDMDFVRGKLENLIGSSGNGGRPNGVQRKGQRKTVIILYKWWKKHASLLFSVTRHEQFRLSECAPSHSKNHWANGPMLRRREKTEKQ